MNNPQTEITDREIVESFSSQKCMACGKRKGKAMSHCKRCYYLLPPEMRSALYNRFGQGYEQAFRASIEYLGEKHEQN